MSDTLASVGEFGLIHRIQRLLKEEGIFPPELTLGLGDDTACFRPRAGYELLVTCDAVVEGRHYLPGTIDPRDLGRRAMSLNISDIGAMGGVPRFALVSLGLKGETLVRDVESLYRGFLDELNPFEAAVVGGNLTKSGDGLFIDITLIGEVEPDVRLGRSGAMPGDVILVTGQPGQAAAGLGILLSGKALENPMGHPLVRAHLRPSHRAREGRAVARAGGATAMIDTSDGFLGDLGHICEESHVGAQLWKEKLPVSEELGQAAGELGKDPWALVLGESDDYELIITCPPDRVGHIKGVIAPLGPLPVSEVGRITKTEGKVVLIHDDGSQEGLALSGWDHFRR